MGDALPLYSRISGLQGFLTTKEALAGKASSLSRTAALECLAALSLTFGSQLGSSIPESVSYAAKHCHRCQTTRGACVGHTTLTCNDQH